MMIGNETRNTASPTESGNQFAPPQLSVGLPWRLMLVSVALFGLAVLSFFGLRIGYRSYLDSRAAVLDENLAGLSSTVSATDQDKFVDFYSQMINLKTVLDRHAFGSNAFTFLERNTIGQVYYTNAEMKVRDRSLALKGVAGSFDALAQQITILNRAAEVDSAILDDVDLREGRAFFTLSLTFKETFLAKPTL